jgi:predicted amidohydrolase
VLLAVDRDGGIAGCQPKTRLYDAFSYRESDLVRPGRPSAGGPVELAGLTLGLVNCYELRFPERARALVAAGAWILTVSAACARGPLKEDHWVTLARARAIENCAYVLAAGARAKDTIGRSMIIDPGGVVRAGLADEPEGLTMTELDTDLIAETRARTRSLPAQGRP